MRVLGLDLGTNSIGWALIDKDKKKIIDTGVRIFPEGVENLGQGERKFRKTQPEEEHVALEGNTLGVV